MIDDMVLRAQQWVNGTYRHVPGFILAPENGKTGWPTIDSLIMGLQHELGITELSPIFGPTTYARMEAHGPVGPLESNSNMIKLVQSALYCKGYDGSGINGRYDERTFQGVMDLQADTGGPNVSQGLVDVKLFKALLSMDAFVLVDGGNKGIREVQQWLNRTYIDRRNFQYVPCDGFFSRGVQTALIYAIQYEIGMDDNTANGHFGPGTRAGLKTPEATLTVGKTDTTHSFIHLFQAAMRANQQECAFDGNFTQTFSNTVRMFQAFCAFTSADMTGIGDFRTWAELLVSTGDVDRSATACDVSDDNIVTLARAQVLVDNGIQTIGRYLAGTEKIIKPGELDLILSVGVSVFPIMQEANNAPSEFGYEEGLRQGIKAHERATGFGFPRGTTIYFVVDYDPQQDEIDSLIIPFFRGARDGIQQTGNTYAVGVYGSRNVCAQISDNDLAVSSFVAGMSTGFSGNMGFPLPRNWSFNQIEETTISSHGTTLRVDRNVKSGRDNGVSSLTTPPEPNAQVFAYLDWLYEKAQEYVAAHPGGPNTASVLVLQYFRSGRYDDLKWFAVAGPVTAEFVTYVNERAIVEGVVRRSAYRDPGTQSMVGLDHFSASANAVTYTDVVGNKKDVNLADFGGWAADLITVLAAYKKSGVGPSKAREFALSVIGVAASVNPDSTFNLEDFIQDTDAINIGAALRRTPSESVANMLRGVNKRDGSYGARYSLFLNMRFNGSVETARAGALSAFLGGDTLYRVYANRLLFDRGGGAFGDYEPEVLADVSGAWVDVLLGRSN